MKRLLKKKKTPFRQRWEFILEMRAQSSSDVLLSSFPHQLKTFFLLLELLLPVGQPVLLLS